MIPWVELGRAPMPGQGADLRLMRRGAEVSIMSGAIELMNSRLSGSEAAMATLTCARVADRPAPRLLIGGLGLGFTLRAALGVLPVAAEVVVAELAPAVIAWARGPLADLFGDSLTDPRVTIVEGDVAALIAAEPGGYDAILLDVDNGPDGLSRQENDGLYAPPGLAVARAALRPRGVLAVWSSAPDDAFTRRLGRAGFAVETVRVRAHRPGKGARHVIWIATRV